MVANMPIDAALCTADPLPERQHRWSPSDVIAYHLGVGAGHDPVAPASLRYAYEDQLHVLPSFGVLGAVPALLDLPDTPGFDVPLAKLLHAEQDLVIHEALPTSADAVTRTRIVGVRDTPKGAIVTLEATTSAETGLLATNRIGIFARGERGEADGGDDGSAPPLRAPDREPDAVLEHATFPWQALLYRLSGDRNPLHADPAVAERAGFERPILHGLCTYGAVLHELVGAFLDHDVRRVRRWHARFTGVVMPGERLRTEVWLQDGHAVARTTVPDRDDAPALLGRLEADR